MSVTPWNPLNIQKLLYQWRYSKKKNTASVSLPLLWQISLDKSTCKDRRFISAQFLKFQPTASWHHHSKAYGSGTHHGGKSKVEQSCLPPGSQEAKREEDEIPKHLQVQALHNLTCFHQVPHPDHSLSSPHATGCRPNLYTWAVGDI